MWGEGQEAWGLGLALPDPLNGLSRTLISGSPCLQREQSDRPVPPGGLCAAREDNERSITLETTKCCRCDEDGDYWSLKALSPQGPGLSAEGGLGEAVRPHRDPRTGLQETRGPVLALLLLL